jgi:hypothetical protein
MRRFLKWLGFHVHDWTQWSESGQIVSTVHNGVIATVQSRTCKECGYRDARKIWLG